jgi:hypothetical protein
VERLDLAGFHDVDVVPQSVEDLRPVRLPVDRLEVVVLDEVVLLGAFGNRVVVGTPWTFPAAGHRPQRTEPTERVRITLGLGIDVGSVSIGCRPCHVGLPAQSGDRHWNPSDRDPR